MSDPTQFLIDHGSAILFVFVFIEQIGLPIPAVPWLLAAGALAAGDRFNPVTALAVTIVACLVADLIWYYLGLYGGARVLSFLCRLSLEPDSCVRRTENIFERHGSRSILASKFLPGLGTVIPPLAGIFRIPVGRFLFLDAVGSLAYGVLFLLLGYLFRDELAKFGAFLAALGGRAIFFVACLLALYIAYKFFERQRVLRQLRIARVTPEEVFQKQEAGETLFILDLRSSAELQQQPTLIRGALHINVADVERRHTEIPRDRDIVVYCSCPNEVTAARVAILLMRKGVKRVRPLLGGIAAWRESNYPLDRFTPPILTL
jgi:membrane protein DedA with SNARE-associated domain/rhodanese-related sulfurtransferase